MNTHDKKPKQVNTKFVLTELNKIQQAVNELDNRMDFLYASVLFQESVKVIQAYKTVTVAKLQQKFNIGYARACYLIDLLEKEGYLKLDKSSKKLRSYIVQAQ